VLGQHAADRLDPETSCPHLVDKRADQRWRGSVSTPTGTHRGDRAPSSPHAHAARLGNAWT
jgi:hypothetical protein